MFGKLPATSQPLQAYQLTPLVRHTAARIIAALGSPGGARVFVLHGPAGAGKTACAHFLAAYLQADCERRRQVWPELDINNDLLPLDAPVLAAVMVAPSARPLHSAVLLSLRDALRRHPTPLCPPAVVPARAPQQLATLVAAASLRAELAAAAARPALALARLAELFVAAAQLLRQDGRCAGLLLIIDDLGPRLANAHDRLTLECLAELAATSSMTPCLLLGLYTHPAGTAHTPSELAAHDPAARSALDVALPLAQAGSDALPCAALGVALPPPLAQAGADALLSGHFVALPFAEPDEQVLPMVAQALRPLTDDRSQAMRADWAARMAPASDALGLRPPTFSPAAWATLLADCYPLHPLVLLALPPLFRQYAQHTRSLMAFLHADTPWSLRELLHTPGAAAGALPIYRLTQLYAYLEQTLGPRRFAALPAPRWSELAAARVQLASDDPLQFQVITVMAMLCLLAPAAGLRAARAQVALALVDSAAGPAAAPIFAALDALHARGMLSEPDREGAPPTTNADHD